MIEVTVQSDDDRVPDFLKPIAPVGTVEAATLRKVQRSHNEGHVPGETGLWVFVLGDMTLFGLFFIGFLAAARHQPEEFADSVIHLHVGMGTVNTILLLVSSCCVAVAVHRSARRTLLSVAVTLALLFCSIKFIEYTLLIRDGFTPNSNLFFTYYFVLTGIHLLHVLIGSILLLRCMTIAPDDPSSAQFVEGSGVYWHMVDALWVVLFPLLYLVVAYS